MTRGIDMRIATKSEEQQQQGLANGLCTTVGFWDCLTDDGGKRRIGKQDAMEHKQAATVITEGQRRQI